KVLAPAPSFDARFLYLYFQSLQISSRGYSRHFKFLRESTVPVFPPSEQRRIVEILDQVDALRRKRAEVTAKADRILSAIFSKLFGHPAEWVRDPSSIPLRQLVEVVSGATPSKAESAFWDGPIPWVSPKDMKREYICDSIDHITQEALAASGLK